MRAVAGAEAIHRLMRVLGAEAEGDGAVYFTGGPTAVLLEPELYRFPALDPGAFRQRVEEVFGSR
jgi:hypothetical protein